MRISGNFSRSISRCCSCTSSAHGYEERTGARTMRLPWSKPRPHIPHCGHPLALGPYPLSSSKPEQDNERCCFCGTEKYILVKDTREHGEHHPYPGYRYIQSSFWDKPCERRTSDILYATAPPRPTPSTGISDERTARSD